MLLCVAVCCSVLQRVAVCCSVLHCLALCCSVKAQPDYFPQKVEFIQPEPPPSRKLYEIVKIRRNSPFSIPKIPNNTEFARKSGRDEPEHTNLKKIVLE